ncbi:hypothetical protein C8Q79DRAFT_1007719 [Trametes meyenii]|nr:hypothetical protein C8Q79DRAFT_1007719 [Trametes meyenii]
MPGPSSTGATRKGAGNTRGAEEQRCSAPASESEDSETQVEDLRCDGSAVDATDGAAAASMSPGVPSLPPAPPVTPLSVHAPSLVSASPSPHREAAILNSASAAVAVVPTPASFSSPAPPRPRAHARVRHTAAGQEVAATGSQCGSRGQAIAGRVTLPDGSRARSGGSTPVAVAGVETTGDSHSRTQAATTSRVGLEAPVANGTRKAMARK